jgi:signal transduction histidine kinase
LRPTLHGDVTRLAQALANYVGNAVKFTQRGGITLGVRLAEETATDCRLRFEVADTGIGIAEEVQKDLFTPFHQVDESTTRKYGGTGLGLAITRRIAELMDGEVGVISRPGAGSTFWLTVRLNKAAAMSGAGPVASARSTRTALRWEIADHRVGRFPADVQGFGATSADGADRKR